MAAGEGHRNQALMENLFADAPAALAQQARTRVGAAAGNRNKPFFRPVSALACDATKKLFAHSVRVAFRFCGSEFTVRPLAHLAPLPELDAFDIRIGDHAFQLEVERLWQLLDVPIEWWENTPGALRADLLADALRELASDQAVRVAYGGVMPRSGQVTGCEWVFALEKENGRTAYRGRLRLETPAAAALLVAAWARLPGRGVRRVPDVMLPVSVELLSCRMSAAELSRLCRGALVPLGAPLAGKDVVVSVGWRKRFVAPAVINNKVVTLQGGLKPMEESRADNVGVALSELSKMDNLEVQFTVELATCSLPLSELSRLGPGSTLNLGLPHEPPLVRLCVNGKPVATGELVVLGQSLGVQIVDMATAAA